MYVISNMFCLKIQKSWQGYVKLMQIPFWNNEKILYEIYFEERIARFASDEIPQILLWC